VCKAKDTEWSIHILVNPERDFHESAKRLRGVLAQGFNKIYPSLVVFCVNPMPTSHMSKNCLFSWAKIIFLLVSIHKSIRYNPHFAFPLWVRGPRVRGENRPNADPEWSTYNVLHCKVIPCSKSRTKGPWSSLGWAAIYKCKWCQLLGYLNMNL